MLYVITLDANNCVFYHNFAARVYLTDELCNLQLALRQDAQGLLLQRARIERLDVNIVDVERAVADPEEAYREQLHLCPD